MLLSEEQREIVDNAEGHFLVRACPGSGKTYTIAAKSAKDIRQWERKRQGLAVISFTNVAQEKVLDDIENITEVAVGYPHFVGTIDSFINQFIFFPYIYLLGFDPEDVQMIGEPFQSSEGWYLKKRCALALRYDEAGDLFLPTGYAYELGAVKELGIAQKAADINNSKFTQSDAVFYSLQILELYPEVVDIVSARFPWLYVDEAQDTTPTHWKILELLSTSKENERFGVIGDPDQSIYAWNGAKPELFLSHQKALEDAGKQVFYLMESHRSSQVICDFYAPYSNLPGTPKAVNKDVSSIAIKPQIQGYKNNRDVLNVAREFSKKLPEGDTYKIVCQSHSFIADILASEQELPANDKIPIAGDDVNVFNLMHAKYDFDRGNYNSALLRAENVLFNILQTFDRETILSKNNLTIREWYTLIEEELEILPECHLSVADWCTQVKVLLNKNSHFQTLKFEPKRKNRGVDYASFVVMSYFTDADAVEAPQLIHTVHSVKGGTFDHILVVLGANQSRRLIKGIEGKTITDTEDKRKLYVAITRARKTLTILIPENQLTKI